MELGENIKQGVRDKIGDVRYDVLLVKIATDIDRPILKMMWDERSVNNYEEFKYI